MAMVEERARRLEAERPALEQHQSQENRSRLRGCLIIVGLWLVINVVAVILVVLLKG